MNEQLVEKVKACQTLPSLPAIAVQVLQIAQSPDADITKIAHLITQDPALSSKILKTVNSSFYGRSQNVGTISQALVILGLQSVKTLVLGFSLVTNLRAGKSTGGGFDHIQYWKRSAYAATAAKLLCTKAGIVQTEEAFLATLLADIGMLVLDTVLGDEYSAVCAKAATHNDLARVESEVLGLTHADVGKIMTESWKLPPLLSTPVAHHCSPQDVTDPQLARLSDLVRLAGRCADVFVDPEAASAIQDVRNHCLKLHKMAEVDCDALLAEIGNKTREIASLFEINLGSPVQYEQILKRANEALVEITLQTQQQATVFKQEASHLAEQNVKLKEQATTDPLTQLGNRQRFDSFLAEQFEHATQRGTCLSLIMIDLDHFKKINDTHGHPAGDAVLRHVAKLLRTAARSQDLACRYGGEEMTLILPGTTRTTAAATAETVRRVICARPIPIDGGTLNVSASIGVASFEPGGPLKTAAHVVKAADLALYNAKHSGRNCVKIFTPKVAKAA
jgi:two-component system, cell cycle response regulator